jgi:FG-GAP-like repeat
MTLRTIFKYAGTGLLLFSAVLLVGQPATTRAQSAPLPFVSVQPRLFGMANSYSNSWGDFDNDGNLDLAVSLGSGEVRLYRNANGTLVSVGKEMGLPQAGGDSYAPLPGRGPLNVPFNQRARLAASWGAQIAASTDAT